MPISSECIEQFKAQRNKADYLRGTLHDSDYENKWRLWARLEEVEARGRCFTKLPRINIDESNAPLFRKAKTGTRGRAIVMRLCRTVATMTPANVRTAPHNNTTVYFA